MASPALLCTDGSDLSVRALAAGLGVLRPDLPRLIVTAIDEPDPTLVTGTGMAGGVITPEELDKQVEAATAAAREILSSTQRQLGLDEAETRIVVGPAGPAICDLASELGATAILIGSRGHGGLRRAVLGSVSDHVVRNAPCPVLVTGGG